MSPAEHDRHHRFLRGFAAQEPANRAYVRRLVPSRADADDVMQEVAVVLWEKFDQFRDGGDFRAWAFGVARFEVLAWLRDKGRDRLVLAEDVVELIAEESAHEEPRLAMQRAALEDCIEKVAPDQRELLMQAYQPDSRIQDVAGASGRTVAGFYQWLHRMRRLLLDCVKRQLTKEVAS
jgi:RNA polymerase sigma-70 factor (ECF subfamily)